MMHGTPEAEHLFDDARVLVTGGTGSLGRALVRRLLGGAVGRPARVTVFSRDEGKQHDMRLAFRRLATASEDTTYRDHAQALRFVVGDVRDFDAVSSALQNSDIVFHTAALKQVPTCEYFPGEAVATNVLGTQNVVRAIERLRLPVRAMIGVSTDKACKPVNVMGMTKALQERILVGANLLCPDTRFVCARYGNVLASRGSVIPVFHAQIAAGGPVTLTTAKMTRFLLTQERAIDALIDVYRIGNRGEVFVPRVRSARVATVAESLIGGRGIAVVETGIRPVEKEHEILVAEDEVPRTEQSAAYYVIRPALPELDAGSSASCRPTGEYSSADALLDQQEVSDLLRDNRLRIEDRPDFANL
ncbi:MAG: polysaccharide biosynthesis protein [Planctomycetota bacterium]